MPTPSRSVWRSAERDSIILSIAKRSKVFCTQDEELRRLAKVLEIDVVDRVEYIERFTRRDTTSEPPTDAPRGRSVEIGLSELPENA